LEKFILGFLLLSPILFAYKLKLISNWKAKEILLSYFFKKWSAQNFQIIAHRYSREKLPRLIKKSAIERIQWHKAQGHKVVIVSASVDSWLKGWCEIQGLDLIATELEVKDQRITGKFLTKNCYGVEKVRRIKEKYNLKGFDYIYAYGDSHGDKEMLELAHERSYEC
jgi:HAD superfamily hydrolase (TIGR01490 family)